MIESWRELVVREAKSWVGTPYHHRGRSKRAGVDCSTFVLEVFIQCGLVRPDISLHRYSHQWHLNLREERLLGVLRRYADEVGDPMPGDVAAFRFAHAFAHPAIIMDWPSIIHATVHGVEWADGKRLTWIIRRQPRPPAETRFYRYRGGVV